MDKKQMLLVAVVALVIGFFVGREEMKYEIASAVTNAFAGVADAFSKSPLTQASAPASTADTAKAAADAKKAAEAVEYAKNIQLYDVTAKYISTYSNEKLAGVRFKIKNNGQKTIVHLCVRVFYQGEDGKDVSEERFCPILADNEFSMGDSKPLRPGYIWQQEPERFYTGKNVPAEWKEGAVTVRVDEVHLE
jgi:hypothetical protein